MRRSISINWYILVSLALLFMDYFSQLGFVKTPVEEQIISIKRTIYSSTVNVKGAIDILYKYPQIAKTSSELDKLRRENQELILESSILEEENRELRHQLEAPLPPNFKFIPAQVVSVANFMEISVGERQGVISGMPVVYGQVLTGQIIETTPIRSKVRLLFDPKSKIKAKTNRGARGQVSGYLNESIIMEEILQKEPLFLDDLVITSGEEGFPPNLLIGKVSHIEVSDVSVYKQAKLTPLVDVYSKKTVFVLDEKG